MTIQSETEIRTYFHVLIAAICCNIFIALLNSQKLALLTTALTSPFIVINCSQSCIFYVTKKLFHTKPIDGKRDVALHKSFLIDRPAGDSISPEIISTPEASLPPLLLTDSCRVSICAKHKGESNDSLIDITSGLIESRDRARKIVQRRAISLSLSRLARYYKISF